jgi:hypothetical protein
MGSVDFFSFSRRTHIKVNPPRTSSLSWPLGAGVGSYSKSIQHEVVAKLHGPHDLLDNLPGPDPLRGHGASRTGASLLFSSRESLD